MQSLKILTKKEIKNIIALLENQFGAKLDLDYVFLMNRDGRIYVINRDIAKVDLNQLRISSIGLYFAELRKGELRLSIEGAQMVGKYAKKNVVELDDELTRLWIKGKDLDLNLEEKGYMLLKHEDDILGCGKAVEGRILNFVPKARRLEVAEAGN